MQGNFILLKNSAYTNVNKFSVKNNYKHLFGHFFKASDNRKLSVGRIGVEIYGTNNTQCKDNKKV